MTNELNALDRISKLVSGFETTKPRVRLPDTSPIFFVDPAQSDRARSAGRRFWLPVKRAYSIFVCAYTALFAIPLFTDEALARQPDRFSRKRLPLTIRSTSSFILDAFGYDRRTEREREVLYSPSPVISSNHRETKTKSRISGPAMAYFGVQLIRGAEKGSAANATDLRWHYDYVSSFFRSAEYGFPERDEAEDFVTEVDRELAKNEHAELWLNGLHAAKTLGTDLTTEDIAASLPPKSRQLYEEAMPNK